MNKLFYLYENLDAYRFAREKHSGKFRADKKTPYIIHVNEVCEFLELFGNVKDKEILTVACLHDTIEKTNTTFSELKNKFGEKVAIEVQKISFDENLIDEKEYFIRNRNNIVKLADHLTNTVYFCSNKLKNPYNYFHKGDILINNFKEDKRFNKIIDTINKMVSENQ